MHQWIGTDPDELVLDKGAMLALKTSMEIKSSTNPEWIKTFFQL